MNLLNRIYEGFDTEEELFTALKDLNYKGDGIIKAIKFKGKLYAVGVDLDNKIAIGKNTLFITEDDYLVMYDYNQFKEKHKSIPSFDECRYNSLDGFYREMVKTDENFDVFNIEAKSEMWLLCLANDSSNSYATFLAKTFSRVAFTKDNILTLSRYIENVDLCHKLFERYINIQNVYPSLGTITFMYQNKLQYVRYKTILENDEYKIVLQNDKFAIEDPLSGAKKTKPIEKTTNTTKKEASSENPSKRKQEIYSVFMLSNRKDDKVYFGVYPGDNCSNYDILNELLFMMSDEKRKTPLLNEMRKYDMVDFDISIIKRMGFGTLKERSDFIIDLIKKSKREMLIPEQQKIKNM